MSGIVGMEDGWISATEEKAKVFEDLKAIQRKLTQMGLVGSHFLGKVISPSHSTRSEVAPFVLSSPIVSAP